VTAKLLVPYSFVRPAFNYVSLGQLRIMVLTTEVCILHYVMVYMFWLVMKGALEKAD
jgi:hypothetical protein